MPSNLFGPGTESRTADDIRRQQEAARAEDARRAQELARARGRAI